MFLRLLPLLVGMAVLVVCDSRANASFLLPGTLPEPAWSGPSHIQTPRPARGESQDGFWCGILRFGLLLLTNVAEVSTTVCERDAPQIGCFLDQTVYGAQMVGWLAIGKRSVLIIPYVCQLFRPPRALLMVAN
jgi:hypothetical protein